MPLQPYLKQIIEGRATLTREEARALMQQILTGQLSDIEIAALLGALAARGETAPEIAGFVDAMRIAATPLPLEEAERLQLVDTCGTGGDSSGTFNISTAAALVSAAAGATVAKHGNRAVTSQSGSADVLEALGVRIDLTPEEAARSLQEKNFAFFFAPNFHPAFKNIGPARKLCAERGQRTIFNFLGPLLNPARPSAMLVGVSREALCEPLAHVLKSLGVRRGMVVAGTVKSQNEEIAALDELSTLGQNSIAEFYHEHGFTISGLELEHLPLQPAHLGDLLGGDKFENAEITRRILGGADRGPKRDIVLLNAGAALFVAGRTKSLAEGWDLAGEVIDTGKALDKLEELTRR